MAAHRRRSEIQTIESQVLKKRKVGQHDIVQDHEEQKYEVEEVVTSLSEGGSDVDVEVEVEMGLPLPWYPTDMIDEQMSWSMVWLPNWDAEFVGRAYHLLYGDVAWDDDIWGLKSIHQIPTSDNSI